MTERPDPTLIRLCCDGEATPEQAAQLREYMAANPDCCCHVESQMECERKLRESIRNLMSACPCAPADLRECICKLINEESSQAAGVVGRIDHSGPERQRRQSALRALFSNTQSANWIAVAATLMLIAGAVLFGIFGRTIDDVRPVGPDLVSEAALYAEQEHRNWASGKKAALNASADAERQLSQWLGAPMKVFDLRAAGYEFIGAEPSDMPVPAKSVHLVYRKIGEPGARLPMLSVFVVQDKGQCRGKLCENQKSGTWSCITERNTKCKKRVMRGTDGNLVYFLVCCDDKGIDSLAQQMTLATSSQPAR